VEGDAMKQPEAPLPDGPFENLLAFVGAWIAIIGLAVPAYLIGSPWGWFVYVGTLLLLFGVMELRNLNNTLVRTLPALRLLRREVRRLRKVEERRVSERRP
jgi:hypothetical protein